MAAPGLVTHKGGCHCGRVHFEVDAPPRPLVLSCSCSICTHLAYLHLIVPKNRFRLDVLSEYTFNTGVARHRFCKVCGVKSFYHPRSHPDGVSVSLRSIEPGTLDGFDVELFDDSNREEETAKYAALTEES